MTSHEFNGFTDLNGHTCPTHGLQPLDCYIKAGKRANGEVRYRCKKCMKEAHRKHYVQNKEAVREKQKEYRAKNIEKIRQGKREWAKKHREREKLRKRIAWEVHREKKLSRDQIGRETLSDWYVRSLLAKRSPLKFTDFPDEVVELKREILKLKRLNKDVSKNRG